MCHEQSSAFFPPLAEFEIKHSEGITFWEYAPGLPANSRKVAIVTDIYGCNTFYQGFASYFAKRGFSVYLVDLFSKFGELEEPTREAAFIRRHKLRDSETVDRLQTWLHAQNIGALIGFCLGGNYVLELARRGAQIKFVAYYPFPAGLANQDELLPPLEYAEELTIPVSIMAGDSDDSAGRDNIAQFAKISERNPILDFHLYRGSGHGFLAQLCSHDYELRNNAKLSLEICEKRLLD